MQNIHKILLMTFSLLLVMGIGCTQSTTTTNATVNTNTGQTNETTNTNEALENDTTNVNAEVNDTNTNAADDPTVDTSDWETYTNEEYGFSFKYPEEWILTEYDRNISLRSETAKANAYTNSFSLIITDKDFETLKNEIEQSDIVNQNISLAKFNDDMMQEDINGIEATTGTHATAVGPVQKYYYIPSDDFSIYIEFFEPSDEINTLVQPVISTLQIK